MSWILEHADCLDAMPSMEDASVDAVVTDPPYGLSFMGKNWDHGVPGAAFWAEALRVAKPGGYLLAFGGTRTFHRLAVAIEDAGWEIRDCLSWLYGSGFPKSLDVSKAIDKAAGEERQVLGQSAYAARANKVSRAIEPGGGVRYSIDTRLVTAPATDAARAWQGWGTALKPAWEPIILARKPLDGTVAANVAKHGTGALNIDATRIATDDNLNGGAYSEGGRAALPGEEREGSAAGMFADGGGRIPGGFVQPSGRWPANVALDEEAAAMLDAQTGTLTSGKASTAGHKRKASMGAATGAALEGSADGSLRSNEDAGVLYGDSGGASRFFYCAKASRSEREAGCEDLEPKQRDEARKQGDPGGDNPRNRGAQERKNSHPTVKPLALMRWLVRLVTPPSGVVLDPFAGSGTTGVAALEEGFMFVGIEREAEYVQIARKRLEGVGR